LLLPPSVGPTNALLSASSLHPYTSAEALAAQATTKVPAHHLNMLAMCYLREMMLF
jgi:hypothetical protein